MRDGRTLIITPTGRGNLAQTFGVLLSEPRIREARPSAAAPSRDCREIGAGSIQGKLRAYG